MSDLSKKYKKFAKEEGYSSTLNSMVENTLSKYPRARDSNLQLTTIVSQELYDEMYKGDFGRKVLIGEKHQDKRSGIVFDVLLDYKNIIELPDLVRKEDPIVLHYNQWDIKKPQSYFLEMNEQYPDITKVFLGTKGTPLLFKLVKDESKRIFVPTSYVRLNEHEHKQK